MKLLAFFALVAVTNADKLNKGYLPPKSAQGSGGEEFLKAPIVVGDEAAKTLPAVIGNYDNFNAERARYQEQYAVRAERPQAALERTAALLRQDFQNNGDSYAYAYETQNGIYGEENGVAIDGVRAQGGYSYTGDDGKQYSIRYTADENGFQPQGDHLPTPHPIPEEILKSLEQNARDEAAGIFDDGSYNEGKYNEAGYGYQYGLSNLAPQGNTFNVEQAVNDGDTIVTNAAPAVAGPVFGSGVPQKVNNAYLPPSSVPQGPKKTYLPPSLKSVANRSSSRFGNRSRKPSFDSKNGYQY